MSKKEMKSGISFEDGNVDLVGFRSNRSRIGSTSRNYLLKDRPFILRFGTTLLIAAMLGQVFFIVPIRTAEASSHVPSISKTFQTPALLKSLKRTLTDYLPTKIDTAQFSTRANELLSEINLSMDWGKEKVISLGNHLTSHLSSIFSFFAPNTASKLRSGSSTTMSLPSPLLKYDFDRDGIADLGRWRSASDDFTVRNSSDSSYTTFNFGSTGIAAPGDFNGDGYFDAGIYNNGTWTYIPGPDPNSTPQTILGCGTSTDIPVAGDFNGDGKTDAAVYTPGSTGVWKYKSPLASPSATPVTLSCLTTCGTTGDIPVPGYYNNDAYADIAVFRPTVTGPTDPNWFISFTGGGGTSLHWGQNGDIPVQGDFDGDNISDPAVYRPSNGAWYWKESSTGDDLWVIWGSYADQPVPGDYDSDGLTDFGIWRPTTGTWYILQNDGTGTYGPLNSVIAETLGAIGDQAIESAYIKQIGSSVTGDILGPLRLKATNATGGTNLNSQNFGWSNSLVSLPGRSGLDLNIGIGYNSLVWIKNGSTMYFDPDMSNVAPGFRIGFPVIEPVYYDSTKAKWTYMMVGPSGARTEFRQQSASSIYDTYDSSYTQLVTSGASNPNAPVEGITIAVKTTDGTQMSYEWIAGAFRCTKILDRNGNYISITNEPYTGQVYEVTDTLGRTISFGYDSELYITSITQTWKTNNGQDSNTTHSWATFSYVAKTVATDWDSSITAVVGPPNDTEVKVLDKITYADGSATQFDYNGYLQVSKVSTLAASPSTNVPNYISTNLDTPGSDRLDCPRFTLTRVKAEDFNGGSEVLINNSRETGEGFSLYGDTLTGTGALIKSWVSSHPNDLQSWSYVGESGWKEGLTLATEDCITTDSDCGTLARWTWNDWETDTIGGGDPPTYMKNPRIKETRIGDGSNVKKITNTYIYTGGDDVISYFGLVDETSVGDMSTVLKTQKNTYITSSNYTDKRIIGLPAETKLYQGEVSGGTLMSKVTYAYDEGSRASLSSATHHDTSNYGTGFVYRGNLTTTKRWDVRSGYDSNSSYAVSSQTIYNIAGSPVMQIDPRGRETEISYTDSWNDSGSRTTYAYPTTITDPKEKSSTIKYRYDTGANVESHSPIPYASPTANTQGKMTSREFDSAGRILRETVNNLGGAYTRYSYNTNGKEVTTYSTIIDTNANNNADSSDEVESLTKMDGAGRVIETRTVNPNSSGGYMGQKAVYDKLGRKTGETVPTEVDSSGDPDGDDSGWKWNYTTYDWKGRTLRITPPDSTGTNDDTWFEYDGCGCAGGQETTIKGPVTNAIDASETPTSGRRWQKTYEDPLGRVVKTELWDLDGNGMPSVGGAYRTAVTAYNGRDQATSILEYQGSTSSSTVQETTMSYDGHGRLYQKHLPQWYGTSPTSDKKSTTYTYNADDTIDTMTDPRGVVSSYSYETGGSGLERPLVTQISYAIPSPSPTPVVTAVSTVTFTYDDAGNRKTMSDGTGTMAYTYDELSRLKTETKDFADSLAGTPGNSGIYTLTYSYNLSGGLKSITEPFGKIVNYNTDNVGRLTGIGNGSSSTSTAYASTIRHRAFGGIRSLTMSTSAPTSVAVAYDDALRPTGYIANNGTSGDIHNATYNYNRDGLLSSIDRDADVKFNQANQYDFAGRLTKNDVGNGTVGYSFRQTMEYDALENLTDRSTTLYGLDSRSFEASYANNREDSSNGSSNTYDVAGNVVVASNPGIDVTEWKFDAAGRSTRWEETGPWGATTQNGGETKFDGDGRVVKEIRLTRSYVHDAWESWNETPSYFIYSSLTGQKITDLDNTGAYIQHHVYMGSTEIADVFGAADPVVSFHFTDPVTGSMRKTSDAGVVWGDEPEEGGRTEIGGLGVGVPAIDPEKNMPPPRYNDAAWSGGPEDGCTDGFGGPLPCSSMDAYNQYSPVPKPKDKPPVAPPHTSPGSSPHQLFHLNSRLVIGAGGSSHSNAFSPGGLNGIGPAPSFVDVKMTEDFENLLAEFGGPLDPPPPPPPTCDHWIKPYYSRIKGFLDELWKKTQDSKSSEAPDGLEAGGIVWINGSRVAAGGIEEIGWDVYQGPGATKDGMGKKFDEWQIKKKVLMGNSIEEYAWLVVHTHPGSNPQDVGPSGPGDQGMAIYSAEAVLSATELTIFKAEYNNHKLVNKILCRIAR